MTTTSFKSYGHVFTVEDRYAEGHALTAAEASALNRLRAENISHQIRGGAFKDLVKDQTPSPEQIAAAEAELAELVSTYDFTLSGGGTARVVDPVEREALVIARAEVRKAVAQAGKKVGKKDVSEENPDDIDAYPYASFMAKVAEVAQRDTVIAAAKKIVAAKAKAPETSGEISLDI